MQNADNLNAVCRYRGNRKIKFNCLLLLCFRIPITKQVPRGTTSTLISGLTPRTSYTVSVSYKVYYFNKFKCQS